MAGAELSNIRWKIADINTSRHPGDRVLFYLEAAMEIRINKEIRNYTESMFFGLNTRQFIFSLLAVSVAVGIYFGLQNYLGTETVSWLCILGAAPFAALGFLRYNGMPAEKCIAAFVRSELLMPKRLTFHPTNLYYEILQPTIRKHEKEVQKNHD